MKAPNKYDECYDEGKKFGFVQVDHIDDQGNEKYKLCPGEYTYPLIIKKMCITCPYFVKRTF